MWRPINALLCSLAVVDALGLFMKSLVLIHFYVTPCLSNVVVFYFLYLFVSFLNAILNSLLNAWLTLATAIVRYIGISRMSNSTMLHMKHVKMITSSTFFLSVFLYIPDWIRNSMQTYEINNETCYSEATSETLIPNQTYVWLYLGRVMLPWLLMIVFSLLIITVICKAKKQQPRLTKHSSRSNAWRHTNRSSVVILGIICSSVLTMMPRILYVVIELSFLDVTTRFRIALFHTHDLLVTTNSSINIIFYMINLKFRETLKNLFLRRRRHFIHRDTSTRNSRTTTNRLFM